MPQPILIGEDRHRGNPRPVEEMIEIKASFCLNFMVWRIVGDEFSGGYLELPWKFGVDYDNVFKITLPNGYNRYYYIDINHDDGVTEKELCDNLNFLFVDLMIDFRYLEEINSPLVVKKINSRHYQIRLAPRRFYIPNGTNDSQYWELSGKVDKLNFTVTTNALNNLEGYCYYYDPEIKATACLKAEF